MGGNTYSNSQSETNSKGDEIERQIARESVYIEPNVQLSNVTHEFYFEIQLLKLYLKVFQVGVWDLFGEEKYCACIV